VTDAVLRNAHTRIRLPHRRHLPGSEPGTTTGASRSSQRHGCTLRGHVARIGTPASRSASGTPPACRALDGQHRAAAHRGGQPLDHLVSYDLTSSTRRYRESGYRLSAVDEGLSPDLHGVVVSALPGRVVVRGGRGRGDPPVALMTFAVLRRTAAAGSAWRSARLTAAVGGPVPPPAPPCRLALLVARTSPTPPRHPLLDAVADHGDAAPPG